MKSIIAIVIVTALTYSACSSGSDQTAVKKDTMNNDSMAKNDAGASTAAMNAPVIKASFTTVNADVAAHIKEVASRYFHIKQALVNGDAAEAKNGATMLLKVISKFDNSLLPNDQKTAYSNHISPIKEQAQAIIASADVEAERTHFAELSTHMYELVKAFGAGKKLYYDHCPMAFNSKGADWLSEGVDIHNPYLGGKMDTCGSVRQVIE